MEEEKDITEKREEIEEKPPSVESVKEALDMKTKEAAENLDKYLRKCADMENYKKRVEKEKSHIILFANEELLKEILLVVDNIERAIGHFKEEGNNESRMETLHTGVELTLKHTMDMLKKFGVEPIPTEGERFDPTLHEALGFEETSESEDGTIIREAQRGYVFRDRLLRPSLVIVSRKPQETGNC